MYKGVRDERESGCSLTNIICAVASRLRLRVEGQDLQKAALRRT